MENFFSRYKNPLTLMAVLFIQVVGLATQVKRPEGAKPGTTGSGTRLIRVWTVTAFTPIEKMFVSTGHFFSNGWHNYADLRGVRKQNRELQDEVARLQMEQVRLKQDADQARRLQALLDFKEKFISRTIAAQVIGTSGTEQSRVIVIDKGSRDGIKQDMAVITPDGIVGKIKEVFPLSSQVLMINDHDSGAGVILESSRLNGIVKGTPLGELQMANESMSDEKVDPGERVITSGGDRIYPKGYAVGTVISSTPDKDNDPFPIIKIKPAADLSRLEEVLVITKMAEDTQAGEGPMPMRAADILSQRLPSIPKQDPNAPKVPGGTTTAAPATASPTPVKANKPVETGTEQKPGIAANPSKPPVAGTGTTVPATGSPKGSATGTTTATPASAPNKAGVETKKPPSTGTGSTTPVGAGGATPDATATPPKPKPTPKATPKKSTTATTDSNTGASESKAADQSGTNAPAATPAATPSPTPEKPPR